MIHVGINGIKRGEGHGKAYTGVVGLLRHRKRPGVEATRLERKGDSAVRVRRALGFDIE